MLRDRDTTANGTLDERVYYLHNWRSDIVALISHAGSQIEQVRYEPYGTPFCLPAGDIDSNGDFDASDVAVMTGSYDVRKDVTMDGTIDYDDVYAAASIAGSYQYLGRGVLSSPAIQSRKGYASYEHLAELEGSGAKWDVSPGIYGSTLAVFFGIERLTVSNIEPVSGVNFSSNRPEHANSLRPKPWNPGEGPGVCHGWEDPENAPQGYPTNPPGCDAACKWMCRRATSSFLGTNRCYDGTLIVCVCNDKISKKYGRSAPQSPYFAEEMTRCVRAHEDEHTPDLGSCKNVDGFGHAPFNPGIIASCRHVEIFRNERRCVENIDCNKAGPPPNNVTRCNTRKTQALQDIDEWINEYEQQCRRDRMEIRDIGSWESPN